MVLNGLFKLPPSFDVASVAFLSDWFTYKVIFAALSKSGLVPPRIVPLPVSIEPSALKVTLRTPAVEIDSSSSAF